MIGVEKGAGDGCRLRSGGQLRQSGSVSSERGAMKRRALVGRACAAVVSHPRLVRYAAWSGALVPVALVVVSVAVGARPTSSCGPEEPLLAGPSVAEGKGAVLTREGEGLRLHFDDARDRRADIIVLIDPRRVLAPGDRVFASMSEPLRSSDRTILPGRDGTGTSPSVRYRITPAGVELCLELNASVVDAPPGRYAGSVGITGEDLAVGSIVPVVATFRSSRLIAIALAAGGVLVGLLVKMFTELAAASRAPGSGAPRSVRAYVHDWGFQASVIVGAIMGWLGYVEIYAANPTWGESESDWLKLFGTCFAFQLASIGGVDLARRLVGNPGAS
jgi:hypothetical protein